MVTGDEGSSESSASASNAASEGGGATAAKQPEQGNSSETANEEEEDAKIWQRRPSLQASGNASQAEAEELTNEVRRASDAEQAATVTDEETGNFLSSLYTKSAIGREFYYSGYQSAFTIR